MRQRWKIMIFAVHPAEARGKVVVNRSHGVAVIRPCRRDSGAAAF